MLTAENITDEQIRELYTSEPTLRHAELMENALGLPSLRGYRIPTRDERQAARARCAEILNERKK